MTDQNLLPPPAEPPETIGTPRKPPQRDLVPWFYGLGFLVLAGAVFYLWLYPNVPSESPASLSARQAVEQRLSDIESRLGRLADLDARLTRLEQRPVPDLGKINARLDTLDGRVADQGQLGSRLDAISGRIESLSGREQAGLDAAKQQLDGAKQQISALGTKITALESNAGGLDTVTKRLNQMTRLQEASLALASGRPIGDFPNAPEALARYSHAPPPTEAQLRLGFPRAEQAALAAKQPDEKDAPLINRAWDRAQGLVSIRRGDDIVVGNPSATVLGQAQTALDAGDLAGAVHAVESLKGPPAQAMATWLDDAKALLSARSALAAMIDKA